MYNNFGTIFESNLKGSENVTIKNVSVSKKKADGSYYHDSWAGHFIGEAKKLVDTLPAGTRIKIVDAEAYANYVKEKKQCYPYLLIKKFELVEKKATASTAAEADDLADEDVDW